MYISISHDELSKNTYNDSHFCVNISNVSYLILHWVYLMQIIIYMYILHIDII